jgi:Ice-binding-like/Secretion system C-terminal sorting domain
VFGNLKEFLMIINKNKSATLSSRCTRFFSTILTVALMVHGVAFSQSSTVNLGTAGNFAILAKTGVSTTGVTAITGNIGISPAAASFITGFGLIADATNVFSTSSLVTGKIYASDYAPPTPANLTTAIGDMQTAYTDAAGRTLPDSTELGAGDITGKTIPHGLYKWGTGVLISAGGVTISGSATDIWIFQVANDLTVANGAIVTLSGGALASNIFWQVAGQVTIGTTAQMKGNILCQTQIAMSNGATLDGRALAQTAVTLNANTIVTPATAIAVPSVPVLVSPVNKAVSLRSDTLNFVWKSAATATGYNFQLSTSSSFSSSIKDDSVSDTTKKVTSLSHMTKYYWRVRSYNGGGFSSFSTVDSLTTIVPASATPHVISPNGTINVERNATFKWHASVYATKYRLQVAWNADVDSIGGFTTASVLFDSTTADTVLQFNAPLPANTTIYWHVSASDTGGTSINSATTNFTTGVVLLVNGLNAVPSKFELLQNYPNPFNPSTKINYSLQQAEMVTLRVYNELGQEVATLVNGRQEAGSYNVTFNAGNGAHSLSSGVYFYRLNAGSFVSTKKLILMK